MAISLLPVEGIPEIRDGDDLGQLIAERAELAAGDVLVVTQKVVSKAEGRVVPIDADDPTSHKAVVAEESVRILRRRGELLMTETRHGFVCANAGVDASNVPGEETVLMLPLDPDASARALRERLGELTGVRPGVVISDSFGRAWRVGQCDVAIGAAGIEPIEDWRGRTDAYGRPLHATQIAIADQLAAVADLARAKDARQPVVIVSGAQRHITEEHGPGAAALLRSRAEDLFR